MKQTPILFSTPMVQSIDQNLKKVTRRLNNLDMVNEDPSNWKYAGLGTNPEKENDKRLYAYFRMKGTDTWTYCLFPYGKRDDLLWVRETYLKPPEITAKLLKNGADTWPKFDYKANCSEIEIEQYKSWGWKLKPSIHMPKTATRIWLKITNIRVERLQNISEQDAIKEGIEVIAPGLYKSYYPGYNGANYEAKESFKELWINLNGGNSWFSNPWVWVIEFEKTEAPENLMIGDDNQKKYDRILT